MDSLLRLAERKYVESRSPSGVSSPAHGGPQARVSSPVALSTLITRAPEVAEHHRRVRAGERAGQVEHEHVGEGTVSHGRDASGLRADAR